LAKYLSPLIKSTSLTPPEVNSRKLPRYTYPGLAVGLELNIFLNTPVIDSFMVLKHWLCLRQKEDTSKCISSQILMTTFGKYCIAWVTNASS
jgi:hypothetical protein